MTVSHIALYTLHLQRMKNYYETYFEAVSNLKYHNPSTGLETYFLSFGDGAKLEIMTRPDLTKEEEPMLRTGWAHLAFQLGSNEEVDRRTQQLSNNGYTVFSAPRITGDGYYESCVADPDGNRVELVANFQRNDNTKYT